MFCDQGGGRYIDFLCIFARKRGVANFRFMLATFPLHMNLEGDKQQHLAKFI